MDEDYAGVIGIIFLGEYERFILVRNHKTGLITFPGGKRAEDENDPFATLERELKEDINLENIDYEIIETGLIYEFVYNAKKQDKLGKIGKNIVYLIKIDEENLIPVDINNKSLGWFNKEQVCKKVSFLDLRNLFLRVLELIN